MRHDKIRRQMESHHDAPLQDERARLLVRGSGRSEGRSKQQCPLPHVTPAASRQTEIRPACGSARPGFALITEDPNPANDRDVCIDVLRHATRTKDPEHGRRRLARCPHAMQWQRTHHSGGTHAG